MKAQSSPSQLAINEIQTALCHLYSSLKTKMIQNSTTLSIDSDSLNNEIPKHLDCLTLVNYIKESIDVLLQMKLYEQVNEYYISKDIENAQEEYEHMLIKYENDIRGHIKVEHQLKLFIDNMQSEIEHYENKNKEMEIMVEKYKKTNYEREIKELKAEILVLKKQNALLNESEKKYREEITKLKLSNSQMKLNISNIKHKLLYNNEHKHKNNFNINSNLNSHKSTRKNSNSATSTNSGHCINNNNNNNNNNHAPKRVINSVTSQLTKRNKISNTHNKCNSTGHSSYHGRLLNRSMSNYYNNNNHHHNPNNSSLSNHNNNSTSQIDISIRSISKEYENLLKKINNFHNNLSLSIHSHSNRKQYNYHCNKSVGELNSKKQYDQIHRIRELILKKEPNIITHKYSDNSKEKMQTCSNKKSTQLTKKPYKKRESINNNKSATNINNKNKINNNNSSTMIYRYNNNYKNKSINSNYNNSISTGNNNNNNNTKSKNKSNTLYNKKRKLSNKKLSTSLIINNSNTSYINNLNILTTSPH